MVNPLVVSSHAVRSVGDVPDVDSQAVVELPFEELQQRRDHSDPFPTGFSMLPGMCRNSQDVGLAAGLQATWSMTGRGDHQRNTKQSSNIAKEPGPTS